MRESRSRSSVYLECGRGKSAGRFVVEYWHRGLSAQFPGLILSLKGLVARVSVPHGIARGGGCKGEEGSAA